MDKSIVNLAQNHKIEQGNEYYSIHINIPNDFIYEIDDVTVRWFPSTNKKLIISNKIPDTIKENIYKFNYMKIEEYIHLLEDNLLIFFMGKIPAHKIEEEEVLGEGELSKDYKFPIFNSVTANIRCDISKTNILLICCQRISIVVKCSKCQEVLSISGNSQCKRCNQEVGVVYVPSLEQDKLGYMQPKRSEFVCFNPLRYQFSCEQCGKAYESKETGINQIYTRKCIGCYQELKFKINSIGYYAQKEVKLIEGQELPEKGACKHYKKSYRWFRFSCCNSVYPCDDCHNEQEKHKAEEAHRMICGLCSKEQSVKVSCDCGMNLNQRKSQFWEGGKGNRDKCTMNKRDTKKNKR